MNLAYRQICIDQADEVRQSKERRYQEFLVEKAVDLARRRALMTSSGLQLVDAFNDDEDELVFEEDLTLKFGLWQTLCMYRNAPLTQDKADMSELLTGPSALNLSVYYYYNIIY
jgi:hypothetical protein